MKKFLSFKGEGTRKNFTDHLRTALDQKGLRIFRDHESIERGKEISSKLLKAIEDSMIWIIIFSRNYDSSTWCLDELVMIVDCLNVDKHRALVPVFYDINSLDVRRQTGDLKKAFDKHEEEFRDDEEKVQKWRSAMRKVASLSRWHLKDSGIHLLGTMSGSNNNNISNGTFFWEKVSTSVR
ncbi:TMV resistance protein N-like [Pistacia vera]|uniref:TMV resistance protein N-like n=1 Tax=Pistacia vera TaxID=55513 RepID=UPI0012634552|nr:TMV resistance protein N-like [Pistacia vera]